MTDDRDKNGQGRQRPSLPPSSDRTGRRPSRRILTVGERIEALTRLRGQGREER